MESCSQSFDFSQKSPLGLHVSAALAEQLDREIRPSLCALIVSSRVLRLSVEAQFNAACLLTRYYCRRALAEANHNHVSFTRPSSTDSLRRDDDDKGILGASLFLGAKVSEGSRRLRDVINCIQMIDMSSSSSNAANNTQDTSVAKQPTTHSGKIHLSWRAQPPLLDQEYWDAKKKIIELEQHLLRWLGFDTFVPSPHRAVVMVVRRMCMLHQSATNQAIASKTQQQQLVWEAWKLINNAMFLVTCLQQSVMSLACAAVALTCHTQKELQLEELVDAVPIDEFEVSAEQLAAAKIALENVTQQLLSCDSSNLP